MGLMDKFKNLFTDEEIIEEEEIEEPVKIKQIKKEEPKKEENKLPTFMREKIEKEEKKKNIEQTKEIKNDIVSDFSIGKEIERKNISTPKSININQNEIYENKISKDNNSFKFPLDLEESDFSNVSRVSRQAMRSKPTKETPTKQENPKKQPPKQETKVSELYKDKKKNKEEEKKFKATPIISPIYGVLDKNYKKEELEPIKGDNYEMHRPSKNIDFDSVRKKAYGSLTEEIKENLMCENCEYLMKAKSCKREIVEDNLMYEALCERKELKDEKEYIKEDITLDQATENYFDYGVEYQKEEENIPEELENVRIVNHNEEKTKTKNNNIPPVKSSINLLSTLKKSMGDENVGNTNKEEKNNKNLELTDDLFNLIDSMYDEGND